MSNLISRSGKVLAGGLLAAMLGSASLIAVAADRGADDESGQAQTDASVWPKACDHERGDRGRHGDGFGGREGGRMEGRHGGHGMDMAMGPRGGMERGMGPEGDMEFRGLELSKEQQAAMTKIRDQLRKSQWAIQGDMMDVHNRIRDLYAADDLDTKGLNKAYSQLAGLQQKMFLAGTEARTSMMVLLTKAQRQQLRDQKEKGGHFG